jgi:hypothetical protein
MYYKVPFCTYRKKMLVITAEEICQMFPQKGAKFVRKNPRDLVSHFTPLPAVP